MALPWYSPARAISGIEAFNMKKIAAIFSPYRDRNLLAVLYLGFASGLPLLLTLSTLSAWLYQSGVSIKSVGLFALVGLPYSLKFLWAPFKDTLRLPWLCEILDQRRSWLFVTQLCLAASIFALGFCDPVQNLWAVAALCLLVAFFSASQDIVSDAYRIELQQRENLGAGAAVQSLGYRLGMLLAGAGALLMASVMPWQDVYKIMGLVVLACAAASWFCPKVEGSLKSTPFSMQSIAEPFIELLKRHGAVLIFAFVILYKLGDALASSLVTPFYLYLGFNLVEIAGISKVFGPIAFVTGGIIGGALMQKWHILRALLWFGILQMLSNFMFVVLTFTGNDLWVLTLAIGIENVTSGMGGAAFVAYLSGLCHKNYTATQYAILSSMMALGRTFLSAPAGYAVASFGWAWFFSLTAVAALPGLFLLHFLRKNETP